jgi:hypothetical protein
MTSARRMGEIVTRASRAADGFALTPVPLYPLAYFRIGVALVLLAQAHTLSNHLLELFGQFGIVQWAIGEVVLRPWMPRLGWLAAFLRPYGILEDGCVYITFLAHLISLSGLLLGWHTRACAIGSWSTHLLLTDSGNFAAYGLAAFAHIALTYCIVMPVGEAFSFDSWARRTAVPASSTAQLSLRVLQIHLCIVYLASGMEKARGSQWWNGEAIWRSVMQPQFAQFDLAWLAGVPALAVMATWATLVVEIGYPIFIWPRATRRLWISVTVALHLGIGLFLGLWLFSAMMITLTASAFGAAELEQARLSIRGWIGRIGGRPASRASDAPVWQRPPKFVR